MIILNRPQTDPYFNLAAEEYLVKNSREVLFMLWQNTNSVVIGKHQNALKEINLQFLKEQNIPVIRRISGGGTVFHDLGNLNYSFIDFGSREKLVNFKKYSQPILDVLQNLGIEAYLDGKSDLKIAGKKFSGNASHVYKNTVLHHGTLLFSSELNLLESSIKAREEKYTDKAVKSNRSRVTNIQSHSPKNLDLKTFKAEIIHHLIHQFPGSKIRDFSSDELNEIQKLANEKYNSWEWNFGYSPRYAFNGIIRGKESEEKIRIQVKNGLIESLETDSYDFSKTTFYQTVFYHIPHQPEAIQMLYSQNESDFLKFGITKENLLSAFF